MNFDDTIDHLRSKAMSSIKQMDVAKPSHYAVLKQRYEYGVQNARVEVIDDNSAGWICNAPMNRLKYETLGVLYSFFTLFEIRYANTDRFIDWLVKESVYSENLIGSDVRTYTDGEKDFLQVVVPMNNRTTGLFQGALIAMRTIREYPRILEAMYDLVDNHGFNENVAWFAAHNMYKKDDKWVWSLGLWNQNHNVMCPRATTMLGLDCILRGEAPSSLFYSTFLHSPATGGDEVGAVQRFWLRGDKGSLWSHLQRRITEVCNAQAVKNVFGRGSTELFIKPEVFEKALYEVMGYDYE